MKALYFLSWLLLSVLLSACAAIPGARASRAVTLPAVSPVRPRLGGRPLPVGGYRRLRMPAAVAIAPLLAARARVQHARRSAAATARAGVGAARVAWATVAAGPPGGIVVPGLAAAASPGVPGIDRLVALGFHHPVVSSRRCSRIWATDGFVSAFPSGRTTVGTVWLPPFTDIT